MEITESEGVCTRVDAYALESLREVQREQWSVVTKLPKYQNTCDLWKVFVLKYYYETKDVELHFSEISFFK